MAWVENGNDYKLTNLKKCEGSEIDETFVVA